ncbi:MAG: TatD family hydrolase, partial [Deltaproteobacteria bacterium]|nr:TatD family hydrolase [Deltaproteobacteria bacterium]
MATAARYSRAMELCDTHCHLTEEPLWSKLDAVLDRGRRAGIARIVVPSAGVESWPRVAELGRTRSVHPAFGVHPWVVDEPFSADHLVELLRAERAVAVGEIGLDFALERFDRGRQIAVLEQQLAIAADLDLPVILHCRRAFDDLHTLLRPHVPRLRGVLHAFSRGSALAEQFAALGLHVAFGGAITRPTARARQAATALPLERILLETDAPSIGLAGIAPEQVEPAHVAAIARQLADLRGVDIETV